MVYKGIVTILVHLFVAKHSSFKTRTQASKKFAELIIIIELLWSKIPEKHFQDLMMNSCLKEFNVLQRKKQMLKNIGGH